MGGVSVSHVYEMGARAEVTKRERQGDNFRMREQGSRDEGAPQCFSEDKNKGEKFPSQDAWNSVLETW